jgi:hypothetical protein
MNDSAMRTMIGEDGSILIPDEFCQADAIEAGQTCEIERIAAGEYRLRLTEPRRPQTIVDILLACPVKGFFEPLERTETTADLRPSPFECDS